MERAHRLSLQKLIKFTSIFYKIRTGLNNEVFKLLYFAFVYPHLLYGIEIYGNTNHCHLSELEKLNNKIPRILQNRSIRTNNTELYKYYDTLPLPLLHNYQILSFLQRFHYHSYTLPDVLLTYFLFIITTPGEKEICISQQLKLKLVK